MVGFLNRRRHLDRLSELLTQDGARGCVVVASGAPGVGKSALLREAAKSVSSRYCYAYCDRKAEEKSTRLPLSELLQRRLSVLAKEHGYLSFDAFRADKRWLKNLIRGGEAVGLVVAKSLLPSSSADYVVEGYQEARSAWDKRGRNVPDAFDLDDQRLVYSLTVLEQMRSIIHIDHAGHLEDNELEILLHLVDQTKAVLFLEYAADDAFVRSGLRHRLADRQGLVLQVEKLEDEYADRLFASLPERFATALREQFVQSGDLRPFDQALAIQSRKRNILEVFDITEDQLQRNVSRSVDNLDSAQKNLLVALSAHAGPVERALLQEFVDTLPSSGGVDGVLEIETAIDELDDNLLVIPTATDVMSHSRVDRKIDQDPRLSLIKLTFRQRWRDFYRDLQDRQLFVSDEERCRQLLHQCAELNDFVGIARTLEEVGKRGIASRNPRTIVSYLQGIIDKLKFAGDRQALSRIALSRCLFFYQAGWFDEALACLLMVEERPRRYQYLLAELYAATEHHAKAIRLADGYLAQLELGDDSSLDAELCLRLIILHGLRNSNQIHEAREYYLRMAVDRRFSHLKGYGTLLRYADLCLFKDEDQPRCIEYLMEAANIARADNRLDEYASVCFSLVQQLGYTDSLGQAEKYLDEVEQIAQEVWLQQAILLTNRAVLALYRGIVDPNDRDRLKQALVLSYDPLDRLLIQINLLVWHAISGDLDAASRAAIPIHRAIQNTAMDTEIRRIALYNIEQLERGLGNEDKALQLFESWSSLDSGIDARYWQFRRDGTPPASAFKRYELAFHPVFLASWHTGLVAFNAIADDA